MEKDLLAMLRAISDKSILERSALQGIDLVADEERMRILYEFAVEVCLTNDPELHLPSVETDEQKLVRILGVRGLGVALELLEDWFSSEDAPYMEEEITFDGASIGTVRFGRDSFLRHPRSFCSAQSPEILGRFEALGTGMLKEAYKVLGTDVGEHVAALKSAETNEQQLKQLAWLNERLQDMRMKDELSAGSEIDVLFYHPARLSAKGIGVYPNMNTSPTCLMKSIIASSFFEQAGATHVHCGVMSTELTEHYLSLSRTMKNLSHSLEESAPDTVLRSLQRGAKRNRTSLNDIGTHAVAVMQLSDGSWYVCDPNYNASDVLDEGGSKRLTDAYGNLADMRRVAPNMELAVPMEHRNTMFAYESVAEYARSVSVDRERIRAILTDEDHESVLSRVYEAVRDSMYVTCADAEDLVNEELAYLAEEMMEVDGYEYSSSLYKYFSELWHKQVVWLPGNVINDGDKSDDEQKMLERCRRDPAYLERRIDDIALLPLLALIPAHIQRIDELNRPSGPRSGYQYAFEVGLPAMRIGSAVLSDFATYFATGEIAPSTWNGNWGSRIPITEHGYYKVDNLRFKLTTELAYVALSTVLRYYQQDGIISKSRKVRAQERSEA